MFSYFIYICNCKHFAFCNNREKDREERGLLSFCLKTKAPLHEHPKIFVEHPNLRFTIPPPSHIFHKLAKYISQVHQSKNYHYFKSWIIFMNTPKLVSSCMGRNGLGQSYQHPRKELLLSRRWIISMTAITVFDCK